LNTTFAENGRFEKVKKNGKLMNEDKSIFGATFPATVFYATTLFFVEVQNAERQNVEIQIVNFNV
jgi:hypothetical protein